ncbi:amino acid ABC transporter permease [Janibacter cremeus]|uniref:amino acid ABC transporter permease n=1 Tax=Janibacter cremeus TaxID=1285192 RepID=UPI0023F66F58|nr:amino acid ABC transporter permease [Janibacter cremeus]WEV76884.1 amino acid ABC transporter permease [Janibacter cremeus]
MNVISDWSSYFPDLLEGLLVSVQLAAISLGLGIPLGLVLAIANGSGGRVARAGAIVLVEIGRGMPALVMLQIVYFGLPDLGLSFGSFVSAAVALTLTSAAYTSEIIRGGLQSVPAGEVEAAEALNMARLDILRFIVIPQGMRVAVPSLMGFSILIFQATALAYTIALPELLATAYSIGSSTFRYMSVLVLAGLMYLAITIPMSFLTERVEMRLSRHL